MPDHRPGPWTYDESTSDIIGADGVLVLHDGLAASIADIRLILAAPDLLTACQTILDSLSRQDEPRPPAFRVALQKCLDSVNKATRTMDDE